MPTLLELLKQRVMIYDGAMGTSIQNYNLTVDGDFEGKENCSEILVVARSDVIREIHATYLAAGRGRHRDRHLRRLLARAHGVRRPERARELNIAASSRELLRINFPRQREVRLLSIADFFSPKSPKTGNQPVWM